MAWGRATTGGSTAATLGAGALAGSKVNGVEGEKSEDVKLVNVVATGSVDQTVKVWAP